jgi:HK97 family phage portal protein
MIGFRKILSSPVLSKEAKVTSLNSDEVIYTGDNKNGKYATAERIFSKGLRYSQMKGMYLSNVWVRAVVDKTVERICNTPIIVKPLKGGDRYNTETSKLPDDVKREMEIAENFLENPNSNNESLINIRKKVHRDSKIYDAAALEIVRAVKGGEKNIELYSVPGDSIQLNVDNRGILQKEAYLQIDQAMRVVGSFPKEKIMYMVSNPIANRVYGLSPLESLIQTVMAELYLSEYNLDFFYNNATPRFAVIMENLGLGQGGTAIERFRTFWDNELRGQPHRPIIVGTENGKIQIQKIGLNNEEMQFQEYSIWLLNKIMTVYGMQPAVLGLITGDLGKQNNTSIAEQERQFKIDAVKPQMIMLVDSLNRQIIRSEYGFGFKKIYLDYDLDLIDKKAQAEWHEIYLRSGVITINEIRTTGLGWEPVPWGNVPYLQNNLVPFGEGKNGQAVPGNPDDNSLDESSSVPNLAIANKNVIYDWIMSDDNSPAPIGWSDLSKTQRIEAINIVIKDREKKLKKLYSY